MGLGLRRVTGVRPFPSPHLPPFPSSNRPPGTNYRLFVCFFLHFIGIPSGRLCGGEKKRGKGGGAAMTRVGRRYSEVSTVNSTFNAFTENRGINDSRLFEGDMILNQRQLDRTEHGMDVDSDRKRASIKVGRLWPKGVVVYQIHSSLRMFVYSSFSDLIVIRNTKLLKIRNGPKNTKMPLRRNHQVVDFWHWFSVVSSIRRTRSACINRTTCTTITS